MSSAATHGRCRPEPGTRGLAAGKHPCGWSEKQYVIGYGGVRAAVRGGKQMAKFAGRINGINRKAALQLAMKGTTRGENIKSEVVRWFGSRG